jgi:hypothetical protein
MRDEERRDGKEKEKRERELPVCLGNNDVFCVCSVLEKRESK